MTLDAHGICTIWIPQLQAEFLSHFDIIGINWDGRYFLKARVQIGEYDQGATSI